MYPFLFLSILILLLFYIDFDIIIKVNIFEVFMNFQTIIEREIYWSKHLYINLADNINTNILNQLNQLKPDVENAFIFKSQYDKISYNNLKEQFFDNIYCNQEFTLLSYKQHPIETILAAYYHYISKNINQTQLFNFVESIINHVDAKLFLKQFLFLNDYDLHSFLLDKIEKDKSTKLKKFLNYFFINNLTPILFKSYLDNKMLDQCQLIIDKYPSILNSKIVKKIIKNITQDDISQDDLYLCSILSDSKLFLKPKYSLFIHEYLNKRLDLIGIKTLLSSHKYSSTYEFNLFKLLKNNLYKILKNILLKKIKSNINLNLYEINLLQIIYVLVQANLSLEDEKLIFNYLKQSNLFLEFEQLNQKFHTLFVFKAIESEQFNLEKIFNNPEIIKNILRFLNLEDFSKKQYDILKNYYGIHTIQKLIEKDIENYIEKFVPQIIKYNIKESIRLYYLKLANTILRLDIQLFELIKNEENKVIFEKVYFKN